MLEFITAMMKVTKAISFSQRKYTDRFACHNVQGQPIRSYIYNLFLHAGSRRLQITHRAMKPSLHLPVLALARAGIDGSVVPCRTICWYFCVIGIAAQ